MSSVFINLVITRTSKSWYCYCNFSGKYISMGFSVDVCNVRHDREHGLVYTGTYFTKGKRILITLSASRYLIPPKSRFVRDKLLV